MIQKVYLLGHSLSHSYRHGLRLESAHEELQGLVCLVHMTSMSAEATTMTSKSAKTTTVIGLLSFVWIFKS